MGPMYTMREWKRRADIREDDAWHWAREYDVAGWAAGCDAPELVAQELARICVEALDTDAGVA